MRYIKLMSFAALSLIILLAFIFLPNRLAFSGGERYTFYLGKSSADLKEVTPVGNIGIYRLTLGKIYGESCEYASLDIASFLSEVSGEVVFEEEIDGSHNYYCTAKLPYHTILRGEKINLHISVRETSTKVATPIIFGSY